MLNPKFIGLDLSCLATCMPNYLLDISTWRKLRYHQPHMFETKLTLPLIFPSVASPSSSGATASFSFTCYIQAVNRYLLTLSCLSTYPATTLVSKPLSSTRIISTAFSTGFLSPVLFGSSHSLISSYWFYKPSAKNVRWHLALKIMTELFNNPPRLCMNRPLLTYPALSPDYPQACWVSLSSWKVHAFPWAFTHTVIPVGDLAFRLPLPPTSLARKRFTYTPCMSVYIYTYKRITPHAAFPAPASRYGLLLLDLTATSQSLFPCYCPEALLQLFICPNSILNGNLQEKRSGVFKRYPLHFHDSEFFFYDCLPTLEKETKIENSKGYEIIKEVNDFNRNNTFNMETQKRDILVKTVYFQNKILW